LEFLAIGFALVCAGLCLRLWYLQILHGEELRRKAENNRLDYEVIKAPRGMIYGRDESVVLAGNRAAFDLVFVPAMCEKPEQVCGTLGALLDIDPGAVLQKVEEARKKRELFSQIIVSEDISKTDRMQIEEFSFALPGVYTVASPQRQYYQGTTAGQLLGWFNEISKEEYERLKPRYKYGDIIGRAGLELAYENTLKGQDGAMIVSRFASGVPQLRTDAWGNPYIELDSQGRSLQVEHRNDAVPGRSIYTTLDIDLQRELERILADDLLKDGLVSEDPRGAIVVLNADTGEVLAMASYPLYDPNIFASRKQDRTSRVAELMRADAKPMLSRCFQMHYPPGSVFKVMLAIAALEEGVIDEHTTFGCGGRFYLPGVSRPWRCWRHKYGGHGDIAVVDALAYSCDIFFYNVGLKLGIERINEWSKKLGLGVRTGIDLPGEAPGLVASPEWKRALAQSRGAKEAWEYKWYPGETVHMSIGQGMVDATPLQNAVLMATVLNGGRRVRPYVNRDLGTDLTEPLISAETLRIVQAGLRKCVERDRPAPTGTGKEAKISGLDILGKTGTAQVADFRHIAALQEHEIPYNLRDHALFVAGVLDREPHIAVSVIVEHGLHGGSAAAPVARKVFEYLYLKRGSHGDIPSEPPISIARRERVE
jgi:penicillin-binding protein 2